MRSTIMRNMGLLIVLILLALMGLPGLTSRAMAQCGGSIRAGETVTGRIARAGNYCRYTFSGAADEAVTITMRAISSTLDPYLTLQDSRGRTLATDDDSAGNYDSEIEYRLAQSGTYTIIAGSYRSRSYGSFSLQLTSGTGSSCGGRMVTEEWVAGTIARSGQRCEYTFEGRSGDVVSIYMRATSQTLDPWLDLLDPRDVRVAYDDDSYGDRDSLISRYRLSRNGTYTIVARSYDDASYGSFELYLQQR